ncbi:disease resistance protein RPV1-like [Bidens hawaiensis]|uniref:disease resistance protein RPV1-like n=1 Tax=Bidens hawaiensis TaxID=980011 RepID=UPI0040491ABA
MTTSRPCFSYDVFLSFRGEDTRKTFTDHLYAALQQAGVRTFRDDDAMDRGRLLGPELKKAIRESAISIIVFSSNYASSKWCLDEVLTIIEEQERLDSKHEVVPVFYNVEPSDVRNQTGSFEEAFGGYDDMIEAETDHQKKLEWVEKVKAWRISLRKAGSLTGMVLANGYEAKFISKIVKVVKKKLDYKLLYIDKLVGIQNNVAEIESWLQDPSPDAVILFIHGMGGIGKTTISKCIFNLNYKEYDSSCFLADIHETSNQHNGLLRLQRRLLSEILRSNKKEIIWNLDEGTSKITNALCNKKVLLILDDISTRHQLIALLGPQQFHHGSKVIITTRHKWLLTNFKVHPTVHTIEDLGPNDSNKLFSLYAFNRDHPIESYIVQSQLVVNYCRGHPLALKVLGSFLNGKTIDVWEDAMRKLEAVPNPEIQKLLQLSYDTLEDVKDKELFLHIACFFVGEDKEFIVKLLAECDLYPIVGMQNLMDRCLLYIENGRVMMHQLIKEMGQKVVRQESPKDPGKRSRLWHHQDSFNVLKENEGTRKVEGLALDMQRIKGINSTLIIKINKERKRSYEDFSGRTMQTIKENFKVGAIEKMKNLLLLQLDYATFSGSYKKLPKKLRLLRWHGFSLKSIPGDVPLENLVVLDLRYSKLKEVWDGFKIVGSLKILNLSYSVELIKTPDFDGLPSLESLLLKGCLSLTQVCESIGYLERLVLLDISGCRSLKDIPYLPRSLETLKMYGCSNVGVFGQVKCLESCSLSSLLVDIDVSECNLFNNSFPEDWSNLISLKFLNISRNNITSLPGCVKSLPSLKSLDAYECSHLQSVLDVPKSVTDLSTYQNMSLEIVQPTPNPLTLMSAGQCEKLCAVEGCFKHQSIKNVDRKILRYLGLELISEDGMGFEFDKQNAYTEDISIKVSYEFGIFSTYVSGKTLPCFMYKETGSTISFRVPSHPNGSRISGMNMSFMSTSNFGRSIIWEIEVNNKTKDLVWKYTPTIHVTCKEKGEFNYVWLSLWRTNNLLDDGDEIAISIELLGSDVVEECCVNLVYNDDEVGEDNQEEMHEETKDTHCIYNYISWSDRLRVEISDYVHSGKTYCFKIGGAMDVPNMDGISDLIVDWWGLRVGWRCRRIDAGDSQEVGEDNQEEMHEETKDTHCIYNYISWSDRLRVEISDYVHSGKTYCFKIGGAMDVPNMDGISDLIVDWWGLRVGWRCRRIDAGYAYVIPIINRSLYLDVCLPCFVVQKQCSECDLKKQNGNR